MAGEPRSFTRITLLCCAVLAFVVLKVSSESSFEDSYYDSYGASDAPPEVRVHSFTMRYAISPWNFSKSLFGFKLWSEVRSPEVQYSPKQWQMVERRKDRLAIESWLLMRDLKYSPKVTSKNDGSLLYRLFASVNQSPFISCFSMLSLIHQKQGILLLEATEIFVGGLILPTIRHLTNFIKVASDGNYFRHAKVVLVCCLEPLTCKSTRVVRFPFIFRGGQPKVIIWMGLDTAKCSVQWTETIRNFSER